MWIGLEATFNGCTPSAETVQLFGVQQIIHAGW
jgi:hypothetical protein